MTRPTPIRWTRRLRLMAAVPAAALLMTACAGDGGDDDVAADTVTDAEVGTDELAEQLGGLEVTVTGNVSEIIDQAAFQIDKDGLGDESIDETAEDRDFDDDYFDDDYDIYDGYDGDYDYYDYDYYTGYDDELDEFDETGVVVVAPNGSDVALEDSVQVNGTLRAFDEASLESIYDVDFDDEVYGGYDRQYVIVADSVKSVPNTAADATASDGSTTTAPNGSTTEPAGGGDTTGSSTTSTTAG